MTGTNRPSDSDGHDETDECESEDSLFEPLKRFKVVLEVILLLRKVVEMIL